MNNAKFLLMQGGLILSLAFVVACGGSSSNGAAGAGGTNNPKAALSLTDVNGAPLQSATVWTANGNGFGQAARVSGGLFFTDDQGNTCDDNPSSPAFDIACTDGAGKATIDCPDTGTTTVKVSKNGNETEIEVECQFEDEHGTEVEQEIETEIED